MPLPAPHLRLVQAAVKMANAPELSLRGGQRPTWRPEREARGSALGVQSREGSSVFAGVSLLSDRILRDSHVASLLGMTNLRASRHRMRIADIANERRYRRNRLVRFYRWPVRTASASPRFPRRFAPRNDKLESFTPQNAYRRYCQPAWRSMSAATDAIGWCVFIGGRCGLQVPPRDSHVASLLGMTNLRASRHRMRIADIASLHGGHGPPCRLTFGLCHYGIGSSAPGAACRSPAMRHRQSADQDTVAGSYSDAERLSDSSTRAWR